MALVFFSASSIAADHSEAKLILRPQWKARDEVHYLLIKSVTKSENEKIDFKTSNRTDIQFKVLEISEDGYVLRMTFGETKFDEQAAAVNPILRQIINLQKGMKVLLKVDREGLIVQVINWEEIRDLSIRAIEGLAEHLKSQGMNSADVTKLIDYAAQTYSSEEKIRQASTREVQLMFAVFGKKYSVAKPYEYESVLPNVLGGEPIPSHGEFVLKSYDKRKGYAVIRWRQTVVPEDFNRIIQKTLEHMNAKLGKPMSPETKLDTMTVSDSGEFVIDLKSGWAKNFSYTRKIGSYERSQIESTSMVKQ